jgi:hypothetical protein
MMECCVISTSQSLLICLFMSEDHVIPDKDLDLRKDESYGTMHSPFCGDLELEMSTCHHRFEHDRPFLSPPPSVTVCCNSKVGARHGVLRCSGGGARQRGQPIPGRTRRRGTYVAGVVARSTLLVYHVHCCCVQLLLAAQRLTLNTLRRSSAQ